MNEENLAWASEFLSYFRDYPGFPQHEGMFNMHAEALLKVVQGKMIVDIVRERRKKTGIEQHEPYVFSGEAKRQALEKGWDETTTDTDWLKKTLVAEATRYPLPPTIRLTYQRILTPADGVSLPEEY